MDARNLVLIGLMGSGKTSVGRRTARRLGRPFVDTDTVIEHETGMTIARIFATEGEPRFRRMEADVIARTAAATGQVVSVGGGAVLDPRNVAALSHTGVLLWLHADAATLAGRLRRSIAAGTRPLLAGTDEAHERLRALEAERSAAYTAAADHILRTDGLSLAQAVSAVLDWVGRQGCLSAQSGT